MAEDLSQTIQEGLAQTLTDLLGIDARYQETTKVDKRDIQSTELLEVKAEFEFDKLPTLITFLIPASSASIVFNTMMGASDFDIVNTLDDDTIDAMGEFVSNVSGSLVTAFNAKEIAELGNSKFHIQHKETLQGDSIDDIENMYRFIIDLDEKPIIIFVKFDEAFLPFIENITQSEPTIYPDEPSSKEEEEIQEEEINENKEETNKIAQENTPEPENSSSEKIEEDNDVSKEDSTQNEETEEVDTESQNKLKKKKLIIIIASSIVALILILILILSFMGSSNEEEIPKEQTKTETAVKKEETPKAKPIKIESTKTLKKVDFNIKDIDVARLNERLQTLTKYQVLTPKELELQKKQEEERLKQLKKEEELIAFAKKNKEEPIKIKPAPKKETPKVVKQIPQEPIKQEQIAEKPQEQKTTPPVIKQPIKVQKQDTPVQMITQDMSKQETSKETLYFILSHNIKYTLFKSFVQKTNSKSARISMCNDANGRTTIFIGPFENKEILAQMDTLIKDSKENIITEQSELTQEQFNQRCNF